MPSWEDFWEVVANGFSRHFGKALRSRHASTRQSRRTRRGRQRKELHRRSAFVDIPVFTARKAERSANQKHQREKRLGIHKATSKNGFGKEKSRAH